MEKKLSHAACCSAVAAHSNGRSSSTSASSSGGGGHNSASDSSSSWRLLLDLPHDLFARSVVRFLSLEDKRAFRQASRLCRQLVNAATHCCVLDAACQSAMTASTQLPGSFPGLRHISIVNTTAASTGSSSCCNGAAAAAASDSLQEQLPLLLRQLPRLSSLSYEGPTDRRQPGLDITPALAAAAAAAGPAAAAAAAAGPAAAASPEEVAAAAAACSTAAATGNPVPVAAPIANTCSHQQQEQEKLQRPQQQDPQQHPQQQHLQQQQLQQQLTKLELRAGRLPDSLMEIVGQLSSLRCLSLTATTAISTAPLARLAHLSGLSLTVTPPLAAALRPLRGLQHLAVLHLAAISPARGWGPALRLLAGCCLQELQLVFADVCDGDLAALAGLKGLTKVDLHCSRHLSPACVPHLAQLPQLAVLHLAHTGLQLGPADMLLLGEGCPHLTQLHAEFDLRRLPEPEPVFSHLQQLVLLEEADGQQQQGQQQLRQQGQEHAGAYIGTMQQGAAGSGRQYSSSSSRVMADRSPCSETQWPPLSHLGVTSGCSVANLVKLLHNCRRLQHLELEGLGPNGNEVAAALASRAPGLVSLHISGCSSMSEVGGSMLAAGLPQLRQLSMVEVSLSASHWMVLLQGLASKERGRNGSSSSSSSSSLTSDPCQARASPSKQGVAGSGLTHLRCERCPGITNEVISHGVAGLQQLQQLELVACEGIGSEQPLMDLVRALPRLVVLVVSGCKGVRQGFARRWETAAADRLLSCLGSRAMLQRVEWQA